MQGTFWINLFSRIPANLHDSLALILVTGSELVVQKFIKLDSEFIVLRGRMAGTTDGGRVVVLPYQQLVAFAFTKRMTDPEVEAIFGEGGAQFAAALAAIPDTADAPAETAPTVPAADPEVNTPAKAAMPSKSMLLAKLRARLAESSKPK
jgi:hypothetical protein